MKIERPFTSLEQTSDQKYDEKKIIHALIELLNRFPYSHVNLEKDQEVADLLEPIKAKLDIHPLEVLISKELLLEKLHEAFSKIEVKQDPIFNDPAKNMLSLFDLVASTQDAKKKKSFQNLGEVNEDLSLISQLIGLVQKEGSEEKVDFSSNPEACAIVDQVKDKFGLPKTTKPYIFEQKNDLLGFLNQKSKELTHRSQEEMMFLQQNIDQTKSFVDITKAIIDEDAKLKDFMLKKAQG